MTRLLAAAVEVSTPRADDSSRGHGFLCWPLAIAPHLVALIVSKVFTFMLRAFHMYSFERGVAGKVSWADGVFFWGGGGSGDTCLNADNQLYFRSI